MIQFYSYVLNSNIVSFLFFIYLYILLENFKSQTSYNFFPKYIEYILTSKKIRPLV